MPNAGWGCVEAAFVFRLGGINDAILFLLSLYNMGGTLWGLKLGVLIFLY
jgi:hypothetical protein